MSYNVTKLDQELRAAGLPVVSVSGSREAVTTFARLLTPAESARAAAVRAAHDPRPLPPPVPLETRLTSMEARLAALEK